MIAAPTGSGKTTAAAQFIVGQVPALWLTDRHEDVDAAADAIERAGGTVAKPLPLNGGRDGVPNCLHAGTIEWWQVKGYSYVPGFCCHHNKEGRPLCKREGDPEQCPYLASLDDLNSAPILVTTKAFARKPTFFEDKPHNRRKTIVLDEDPIGLLRPAIEATREELECYLKTCEHMRAIFYKKDEPDAFNEAKRTEAVARWCWDQINRQEPGAQPQPVEVPPQLGANNGDAALAKSGRGQVRSVLAWMMRKDPAGTVRNLHRDLDYMLGHAAARTVFVTSKCILFHLEVNIPAGRKIVVLDATANAELLRPIFAPRHIRIACDEPVRPAGRIIQFVDFNGPRSYLNKIPDKVVRILDAIGDHHPSGTIVLISHASCEKQLAKASRHNARIRTAHFGAVRGRNDLEPGPKNPIVCHVVIGSPKTTEEDRRQLALAVFGKAILPFSDLEDVRRAVRARLPHEVADGEEAAIWEVKLKGYKDPRMQAVYAHSVTAELTHAADRARILIHRSACVYLVTNEPCPRLFPFVEMCHANECFDLSKNRAHFDRAYASYKAKVIELLDAGEWVGNADVCRALHQTNSWGWRYWRQFRQESEDALEGDRKVRWRPE